MSDRTDIVVVLDRSGSMAPLADDTIGGFDAFVKEQQGMPGECRLTLVQFDTEYEVVHYEKPIHDIPGLVFEPRGCTALLDAVGRAIHNTESRIGHDDPKVIFVIITDGQENSSLEYNKQQVLELVEKHKSWQFMYFGAGPTAFRDASGIGIGRAQTMSYAATGQNVARIYSLASRKMSDYRVENLTKSGSDANVGISAFTDEERKTCAE